jgi:hypothetical protein
MKHEEIWHTCDRCGKKIKPIPAFGFHLRRKVALKVWESNATPLTYAVNKEIKKNKYASRNSDSGIRTCLGL